MKKSVLLGRIWLLSIKNISNNNDKSSNIFSNNDFTNNTLFREIVDLYIDNKAVANYNSIKNLFIINVLSITVIGEIKKIENRNFFIPITEFTGKDSANKKIDIKKNTIIRELDGKKNSIFRKFDGGLGGIININNIN